jgi:hypothetical protein
MLSSLRAICLACAFAGTLVLCAGCSQGEGDRCEITSDCSSGLVCASIVAHNGVCRPVSSPGAVGGTVEDAAGPAVGTDAGDGGAAGEADAGDDGPAGEADAVASVDAGAAADGATVGVDTLPDAEAATDLSAAD